MSKEDLVTAGRPARRLALALGGGLGGMLLCAHVLGGQWAGQRAQEEELAERQRAAAEARNVVRAFRAGVPQISEALLTSGRWGVAEPSSRGGQAVMAVAVACVVAVLDLPRTMKVGEISRISAAVFPFVSQEAADRFLAVVASRDSLDLQALEENLRSFLPEQSARPIVDFYRRVAREAGAQQNSSLSTGATLGRAVSASLVAEGLHLVGVSPERQVLNDTGTQWVWQARPTEALQGDRIAVDLALRVRTQASEETFDWQLALLSGDAAVARPQPPAEPAASAWSRVTALRDSIGSVAAALKDVKEIWLTLLVPIGLYIYGLWKQQNALKGAEAADRRALLKRARGQKQK